MCGCLSHALYWAPSLQPRHVPWLGIELVTLWFIGWHLNHWETPARDLFSSTLFPSGYMIRLSPQRLNCPLSSDVYLKCQMCDSSAHHIHSKFQTSSAPHHALRGHCRLVGEDWSSFLWISLVGFSVYLLSQDSQPSHSHASHLSPPCLPLSPCPQTSVASGSPCGFSVFSFFFPHSAFKSHILWKNYALPSKTGV